MAKTPTVFPDNDGDEKSGVSGKTQNSPKFNERALCNAFVKQFCTLGLLTSAETGEILGIFGRSNNGNRPRV